MDKKPDIQSVFSEVAEAFKNLPAPSQSGGGNIGEPPFIDAIPTPPNDGGYSVESMNRQYAVVNAGGKTMVMQDRDEFGDLIPMQLQAVGSLPKTLTMDMLAISGPPLLKYRTDQFKGGGSHPTIIVFEFYTRLYFSKYTSTLVPH